jgi:hypothetical protein
MDGNPHNNALDNLLTLCELLPRLQAPAAGTRIDGPEIAVFVRQSDERTAACGSAP